MDPERGSFEAIHRRRRQASSLQTAALSRYLEGTRSALSAPRILVLNGWADALDPSISRAQPLIRQILKSGDEDVIRSGGYWLHLGHTGIVLNPGDHFLERFHNAGLHLWDIDHVVVSHPAGCADLARLWAFNREMNTLLREWGLPAHIVRYWLDAQTFEQHAAQMRPGFREEKDSVHRLELFGGSIESLALNDSLLMDIAGHGPLGVRFRTTGKDGELSPLGFLSGLPWDDGLHRFFSSCQTLVFGLGDSPLGGAVGPEPPLLGYDSVLRFLEKSSATLAIISEHGFSEGDGRLEWLNHIRQQVPPSCALLPGECGLTVFLDSHELLFPGLASPIPARDVCVTRSSGLYSPLAFFDMASVFCGRPSFYAPAIEKACLV